MTETQSYSVCRTCLSETADPISLFEIKKKVNDEILTISDMISLCTSLEFTVEDDLPTQICKKCVKEIDQAFDFRQRCIEADSLLRQNQNCKNSLSDEDSNNSSNQHHPIVEIIEPDNNKASYIKELEQEVKDMLHGFLPPDMNPEHLKQVQVVQQVQQAVGESSSVQKPVGSRGVIHYDFVKKETGLVTLGLSNYSSPNSLLTFNDYKAQTLHECEFCGKKLVTKTSLKNHVRTHTGEKPYECEVCCKKFATNSALEYHIGTHAAQKQYKCKMCKKKLVSKVSMEYHMRTHSGEKPYKCDICDKPLTTKSALEYHTRTHTGEKPFKCEVCGKYLASKPGLDYHMKVHLGGTNPHKKSHECEICGKILTTKPGLEYHMKLHIDEKPYKCDICNIAFVQQQTLDMHNQMSHNTRGK